MPRTFAIPTLLVALIISAAHLPAQSDANPYPQVQPFPQGSTFGSPSPQVQQQQYGQQQYGQQQPYNQSQPQYGQYQNGQPQQDVAADQQHGVARLSVAEGQVNVRRGDTGDLVAAVVNAPLMTRDHVQTSGDGRAELELDYGSVIRIAPNTDLGLADIEYHKYQVTLGVGTILYRVLRDSGAQAEVDTPSVAVHPSRIGEYRISVYDDGAAQITVRSGALELVGPSGSQWLSEGQSVLVQGSAGNAQFQNVAPPQLDDIDGWSQNRDRPLMGSRSYDYVSPDIAGAEDLDENGSWVSSQYGEVWQPRTGDADWAPYTDGSWAYEPYYGWSWVDRASWGWAPYHYGRWFYNGGHGWCWWPGERGLGIGWSPALVGFCGIGSGIGWVSLAPFEPCYRWWGFGVDIGFHFGDGWGYGRGDLWHTYRNLGCRGGAVWASYERFGSRGGGRFAVAGRTELSRASWLDRGRFPVQPTRASYAFTSRAAVNNPRLAVASNRTYFQSPQGRIGQMGGVSAFGRGNNSRFAAQGFGQQNLRAQNVRPQNGGPNYAGRAYPVQNGRIAQPNSSGWHNFGQPGSSAAVRQGFYGSQQPGGAWHSFGQAEHGVPPNRGGSSYSGAQNYGRSQGYGSAQGLGAARGYAPSPYSAPNASRYAAPSYSAPRSAQPFSAPRSSSSFSAPNSAQPFSAPRYNSPSYSAPHYSSPSYSAPHYNSPSYSAPHYNSPSYSAPHYSAPSYSAPRSSPSYSAPHYSAPSYSAPRGGGQSSAPRSSGGGSHGGGGHR